MIVIDFIQSIDKLWQVKFDAERGLKYDAIVLKLVLSILMKKLIKRKR